MREIPESQVRNLDRPGAPLVCGGLRSNLFKHDRSGYTEEFSFADGLRAEREQIGEEPATHVRINRCHGHPTIVSSPPEPWDIELRAGLITWDAIPLDEESTETNEGVAHARGTLNSYSLATHVRRSWTLPRACQSLSKDLDVIP